MHQWSTLSLCLYTIFWTIQFYALRTIETHQHFDFQNIYIILCIQYRGILYDDAHNKHSSEIHTMCDLVFNNSSHSYIFVFTIITLLIEGIFVFGHMVYDCDVYTSEFIMIKETSTSCEGITVYETFLYIF